MKNNHIIFSNYDNIKNPYYGGGGALAVHEVAKRLAKKFQVTVLTGNYPEAKKNETIEGVRYEHIGPACFGAKLSQLFFHFFLQWQVKRRNFAVWIESFTPPFSTSCLPLFTTKPVIGLVHMLSGEDMRRKYFLPFDWIEKIGLKIYKHCIVLSEAFQEKIMAINGNIQISVIPNGADLDVFDNQEKAAEYILFIGRIEVDQKGLDLLLEAYKTIQTTVKIPLLIAGSGSKSEIQKLQQIIRDLKLENRVKLLGKIKGGVAKKKLFQKAIFCVIPSRFETFTLVALEAMVARTPVVGFDIDGLRWISEGAIVKVQPFNVASLAQKMLELFRDLGKREDLAQKGRACAEQYDWNSIAEQYEAIISNVQKK